jgi:arginine repressor
MSQSDVAFGVEQRRRLIVELLRTNIITSVKELAQAIERLGHPAPTDATLRTDLERIGVVRVSLGNNVWRYRTADLVTVDDVRMGLQDRLNSDGMLIHPCSDGLIIRTTKGTASAVAGLVKMLIDYELDPNLRFVLHDHDDTVMVGITPAGVRNEYINRFRSWMGTKT